MSGAKLKLMCLVWPDDKPDEHIVPVKIGGGDTVARLKRLIKDEHAQKLDEVAACDLILWKCSGLPDDDNLEPTLKTIRFDGSDDRLVRLNKALRRISQLFGDEYLSKEPIHILVEVPVLAYAPRGPKRKHSEETEARKLLRRFADHAPSSLADATTFQKAIRTDLVRLNRPFEFHTIPIALLQKEFGAFRDDCEAAPSVQAQKLSLQL
ncbi:hypothetical protein BGW80DRAFT_1447570, partial [Lactifluus volemus]